MAEMMAMGLEKMVEALQNDHQAGQVTEGSKPSPREN